MLQYLTGGAWGIAIRRQLEAAARTLPLCALFFLPVALGIHKVYEWTHEDVVAKDELLQKKALYLNEPFFFLRAAAAFAGWILLARFLARWSRAAGRRRRAPCNRPEAPADLAGGGLCSTR